MSTITLDPASVAPGGHVNISGAGFNPKVKFALTTVDSAGVEVGQSSNTNRARRDGSFSVGIYAPPKLPGKVRAYQGSVMVAEAALALATTPTTASIRVTTIPALLTSLADNAIDEIVVANGTYRVSPSSSQASNSLWIGSRFAGRTRPVTVRAETKGGVTFDGGGARVFGGISFEDGAHHQTWDGFQFANGRPFETGVVMFGGYGLAPAHHITLRNLTILPSVVSDPTTNQDHCMYFSSEAGHDILIEDYTATPGAGVQSALQFHHSPNAYNVTVRRMHVVGTQNTILIYEATVHDVLIEDSDIRDARDSALNVNATGANVVLRNVTSVNSGGTYYPNGKPAGLSLVNCSFA